MQGGEGRGAASTATYKPTVRSQRVLLQQDSSLPEKSLARHTKITCSTTLFVASLPIKIILYVPKACKPKPNRKLTPRTKLIAITKTVKDSRSGVVSEDNREWFRINNKFIIPSSNNTSHLVGLVDVVGSLSTSSE
ncbi:hypothetical protein BU23DRAFT_189235 [Bimuria novae-zelandiae CBS 107.79]|uniref:Uncharacterized protein n=1 Tax=Bimuria novae-zelandiae CBS 107.79 TaxID=1447943 RepID=A0A6A5VNF2_9PLEO|nr:hypothetical protein BU23DRAFT_189235 [Bimuria novae-zelandiae CBS 107.79]